MIASEALGWGHVALFMCVVLFSVYLGERSKSRFLLTISCIIMICVAGLRHGYVDTRLYREGFISLDVGKTLSLDYILNSESRDRGFSVLSALIKCFSEDSQIFFLIFSVVTVGCLFYGIINRAPEITFAVFLFICTGCYLDTMNGMRQAFVSAVLFFLLPRLKEDRNLIKYLVVVLLASTVHMTALVFIPLYFIMDVKAWSSKTWIMVGVVFLVFIFFTSGIGVGLANILEGTSYGRDYGQMLISANTSVNYLRVIVAVVPLILSFMNRNDERKKFSLYDICFNMSIVNAFAWLLATNVLYFYRLAVFFQPYMILLLCMEIYCLEGRNKKLIKTMAIVLYFAWHVYSLHAMGDLFFVGYLKY